jgi:hypothetical protein
LNDVSLCKFMRAAILAEDVSGKSRTDFDRADCCFPPECLASDAGDGQR